MVSTSEHVAATAQTWFQRKRIPLYVVVGSTVAFAAYHIGYKVNTSPQVCAREAVLNLPMQLCPKVQGATRAPSFGHDRQDLVSATEL